MIKKRGEQPQLPDDPRLKMVKRVSKLMDEEFSIGGFRFGLDPILNLFPIAGDAGSYLVSLALIVTMLKHGASGKVAVKMAANATLDAIVGAIPFLGWVFDFFYKANTRNVKLLAEFYQEGKHKGSGGPVLIPILIVFFIVLAGIIWLSIILLRWLIEAGDKLFGISL